MSSGTSIWMPLYPGDYLRDTMHLSREDHGSYLLLIMAYWSNGGPLPDDDEHLAGIAKCSMDDWTQTARKRLARFFQTENGVWRHKRVEAELERAKLKHAARSRAAHIANEAKTRKRSATVAQSAPIASSNGTKSAQLTQSQSQAHKEGEEAPPIFEPLNGKLFRNELLGMIEDAKAELKRIKNTDRCYFHILTKQAIDAISFIESKAEPNKDTRVAEIKERADSYQRTTLKPLWLKHIEAWRQRIKELEKAANGIV